MAASAKACNFDFATGVFCELSKNFLNIFLMRCKTFLKVRKNTGEEMFAKISPCRWLFRKNNTINCDDNDDLFPNTRVFGFTRQPMKRTFTWSTGAITESICVAAPPFHLN